MAKLGSFINVSNIRGKLGGEVFTRGHTGATLRLRVKGTNPRTVAQTKVRAILTNGSRFAKGLTPSQLTQWKGYATTITKHNTVSGQAYSPTFITAINALYVPFFLMTPAGTFPTTPPAGPYLPSPITFSVTGGTAAMTFTGNVQQAAGEKTFFMLQKLKGPNRTASPKAYKIYSVAASPSSPFTTPIGGLSAGTYATATKTGLIATGQESQLTAWGNVVVT